jgi:hypothetical protein
MTLTEGQLRLGRLFESEFERQAHARGYHVVRHCDQLGVNGTKAPIMTGPYTGYRLPDFTILANGSSNWVEAKYKGRQAFYGIAQERRHGIDLPNWRDYLAICKLSGLPGFLVLGDGTTGEILIAPFKRLALSGQLHASSVTFPKGMMFWSVDQFRLWGSFEISTGQMKFDFGKGFA